MCWFLSVLSLCAVGLPACGCSKENNRDNRESSPDYDSTSRKSRCVCVCGDGLGSEGEVIFSICTSPTIELKYFAVCSRSTEVLQFRSKIICIEQTLIIRNCIGQTVVVHKKFYKLEILCLVIRLLLSLLLLSLLHINQYCMNKYVYDILISICLHAHQFLL